MTVSRRSITVLHVDDESDFGELVATFLEREAERIEVLTAASPAEGLDGLADRDVDCVVSDYDMPDTDGIEFLEAVREEYPDLPFILFTGKGSEEIASEAVSAGVSDYLQKGTGTEQYAVLANRVENLVSQRRAEARLETRVRQQGIVTDLGQDALSGTDVQSLLDRAVAAVADALDTEYAAVLEYRPECDDLLLRAGVGWREDLVGEATVDAGRGSQSGYTLRSEEPVVVEDLPGEERFEPIPAVIERGVVSGVSVVVGDPDDPWGVLATHATVRTPFAEEDTNFVQSIANVLATAIERAAHERELERTKERLELALEGADLGVFDWDVDSDRIAFDERVARIVGYSPEELDPEREAWLAGIHSDDRPHVEEQLDALFEGENEVVRSEYRVRSKAGEWKWVRSVGTVAEWGEGGEPERVVGVHQDLTERKRRERELESIRERMEFALDATDSYIFAIDLETGEEARHGVFERVHGIDPAEVPTAEAFYERAVHPSDRAEVERAEREAADRDPDEAVAFEYRTHPDNGSVEWVRSEAYVRAGPDGEPEQLIGLATAITERKRRERELERQNERLEEFASVVSHDLQNPLNVATGRLNLAREECESEHLDDVARAHERIRVLIDDLLAIARDGEDAARVESIDFATAVAEGWRTVETGEAVLDVETERTVRADESRLRQLLENLFRNAVEHGGETVTITVGDLDDGFYVEDDGAGIPPAERERVFESGFSTSRDGTGFGLSIVEGVVDAHEWEIRTTEGADGGARFEVTGVEFADG